MVIKKIISKKEDIKLKVITKKPIVVASKKNKIRLNTREQITWCIGCPDFLIFNSVKKAIENLMTKSKIKHSNFVMTADVGCNSKIFDYLNISGFYGLHGRSLPTGLGITIGNPNLKVLSFTGDGGLYNEGVSHLIHAGKYNADMSLIIFDNQVFSLTTGQPSATTQEKHVSKVHPHGVKEVPLNPIKLALACNISFIARCNARDVAHTTEIIEKAVLHKGFSFVEIIQDCIIFNKEVNIKDKMMHKIPDNKDKATAEKLADEWNYNTMSGTIPMGVIYQEERPTLTEKWIKLNYLKKNKLGWVDTK